MKLVSGLSYFILFTLFFTSRVHSQVTPDADSLEIIQKRVLRYLEENQQDQTISGYEYAGEWPSFISLRTAFLMLASPPDTYDSNCFSTSAIHNSLAAVYLLDPESGERIPAMVEKSFHRIMSYHCEGSFNFWPHLPPKGRHSIFKPNKNGALVRRPIQFPLMNSYIRKAANICNDNDDTAQSLMSLWYLLQVRAASGNPDTLFDLPRIDGMFDRYRDSSRLTAHYYNIVARDQRNSGAFLTWRSEEKMFPSWNIPRLVVNNAFFLFPVSSVFPISFKPYMPFGANDIDAVLNANVMTVLSTYGQSGSSIGFPGAAEFITSKLRRKKWSRAGVYYPNRYHIHYAVMRAYEKNHAYLDESADLIKAHLKESQEPDGSYKSRKIVNKGDILQSTAYALSAMLRFGNPDQTGFRKEVDRALNYILGQAYSQGTGICWEGGIFFSGGTVIRNTFYWKSDSYTTALLLEAITMYRKYMLENETLSGRTSNTEKQ